MYNPKSTCKWSYFIISLTGITLVWVLAYLSMLNVRDDICVSRLVNVLDDCTHTAILIELKFESVVESAWLLLLVSQL